jgi:phospholipid-transporting ATPase
MADTKSAIASRTFYVNDIDRNANYDYPDNYLSTTKYTWYTFLPLSLVLQFTRVANIYFLITAILQSIPEISPLHPFSAIAPLLFVLGVAMIRDGIEDYFRFRSD